MVLFIVLTSVEGYREMPVTGDSPSLDLAIFNHAIGEE